jgi:hypothetical protein
MAPVHSMPQPRFSQQSHSSSVATEALRQSSEIGAELKGQTRGNITGDNCLTVDFTGKCVLATW